MPFNWFVDFSQKNCSVYCCAGASVGGTKVWGFRLCHLAEDPNRIFLNWPL